MAEEDQLFTLQFIEDYKNIKHLWDHNNPHYTNKIKRNEGLQMLATKYRMDTDGVKKKIKSLRSYFSKEYNKILKKNIDAGDETYHSPWFAFDHLLFIAETETLREGGQRLTGEIKFQEVSIDDDSTATPEEELQSEHECAPIFGKKRGYLNDDKKEEILKKIRLADKQGVSSIGSPGISSRHIPCQGSTHKDPCQGSTHKDGCAIFGELIANKLRNLKPRNRILAERQISNIFFDLELEELDSASNEVGNTLFSTVSAALSPAPPKTTSADPTDGALCTNNLTNSKSSKRASDFAATDESPFISQNNSEHINGSAIEIKKEDDRWN